MAEAKTSFTKENKNATVQEKETTSDAAGQRPLGAAQAPAPAQEVGPYRPENAVQGEVDASDFNIPQLKIVQSVGPLSEVFTPGLIVFGGELIIHDPDEELKPPQAPVRLTVVRIKKQYIEDVEYGGEERAKVLDTMAQVKEAGGYIEWGPEGERPPYSAMTTCQILIEKPETVDEAMFPFVHNGKHYAMGLWQQKGTQYTMAGKLILTASQFALKDGLYKGSWNLTTKRQKRGTNMVQCPILKHGPRHDAEMQAFILDVMKPS